MSDITALEERLPPEEKEQNSKSDISLKERFFRYFQHEITALQEQMDRLADTSLVAGERSDAVDHCLAGIARLSNEVKDASSYIPTYDQRIYAEAIKALQDKLAETRAAIAPRTKFSFKTKKNASAVSLTDAAEIAAQGRRHIPPYRSPDGSSRDSSINPTPNYASTPVNEPEQQQLRPEIAPTSSPAILEEGKDSSLLEQKSTSVHRPTFSNESSVSVNNHYGLHIMLPATASSSSVPASITSLRHCVVDMSIPTTNGKPYASLTVKGVKESLLICGQVEGPAHITGVEHSVIVVSCRQFRMHNCVDVDVYLSCSSNPIIEDCSNIRFGRIPKAYALDQNQPDDSDRWNQVEDFKWIKPEPSPNWSILDQNAAVPEEVWAEMVPGGPCWSLEDILRRQAGISCTTSKIQDWTEIRDLRSIN
ncbi:Tubulin-specific chaperone c [Rasamsonia emersonii CBS 393.64]|uniref:Tubulin-specific chaperone c n=1 Tax=Rasamsonia emersonii (strain ATCC 16479 / CBS 393.64 / IMI 116815) TaxID=1408163 RepID=A0A0F4YPU3_RASE3|nr:Tubulin-specific chaperone c [Rasamsonia emersonii CBS 393.64]KKA20297.1 Tubulin-specific chaperone c [Rasamsonia emersonii CBS 393.64]